MRLYRDALQGNIYGSLNIYNTSSIGSISVPGLAAGTDYQICAYAENVFGSVSDGSVAYWSTSAVDVAYNWAITASGPNQVNISNDNVNNILSYTMGVNPKRNTVGDPTYVPPPTTRRLQTHTYTWNGTLAADIGGGQTTQAITNLDAD